MTKQFVCDVCDKLIGTERASGFMEVEIRATPRGDLSSPQQRQEHVVHLHHSCWATFAKTLSAQFPNGMSR
jgi:hypothetical protein